MYINKYFIEDFIEDTNNVKTTDEVFSLYMKAIEQLGFDSAIYTFVTDHIMARQKAGHAVKGNYPNDWMKHYLENSYQDIDPVIEAAFTTANAFSWDNMEKEKSLSQKQTNILRQAEDSGLRNGIGVPLYGPRAELAGIGIASKGLKKNDLDCNILSKIQLLTQQFHNVYCDLGGEDQQTSFVNLTKREIEILKWLAIGKTKEEIGIIIGCKENTVRFHIKNIFFKLDVTSKVQAITKSIRMGLISYDAIKL